MAADLVVAHHLERSYSAQISYEVTLNEYQNSVAQLRALADAGAPATFDASEDDWTGGVDRVQYASVLFVDLTQKLLNEAESSRDIAFSSCGDDLRSLSAGMQALVLQVQRADEAHRKGDKAGFDVAWMAADRDFSRLHTILGNIGENISHAKNEMLIREADRTQHARSYLITLTILGFLLLAPVTAYARRLSKEIARFDAELQAERDGLEQRVLERTARIRTEIAERTRIEDFNRSRNRMLEMVAEGASVADVLSELALAVEKFYPSSRCVISICDEKGNPLIAPSFPRSELTALSHLLAEPAGSVCIAQRENRAVFLANRVEEDSISVEASTIAKRYQFGSWWSVPCGGEAGTISMLQSQGRLPCQDEMDVLFTAARMARMAVAHSQMHEELIYRAHHDPLTQLPNRALCDQRIDEAIARANRHQSTLAVLCIDLDEFKQINDEYGHEAGDSLLRAVAERLTACLRATDTLARLGGDEFMVVLEDVRDAESVEKVAELLLRAIAKPVSAGNVFLRSSASIGAALYPSDGSSASQLKVHADQAMYRAKELGRNAFQVFSPELSGKFTRRHKIETHLRDALENGGFEIDYQPQYTLEHELIGLEALLRFRAPELKSISPAEFIPVAEQTGLIVDIGQWVLKEVCRQGRKWRDSGFLPLRIAINVSALELAQDEFSEHLSEMLRETGFDARCLEIEVTETAMMSSIDQAICHLRELSLLGIEVSVDDFGTGHSSLSYLHRLPINTLKVDRSFVSQITDGKESVAIIRAIIALAGALGLKVVAEGVETEEQLATLADLGCKVVQGFLFSRPLRPEAVEEVMTRCGVHTQGACLSAVASGIDKWSAGRADPIAITCASFEASKASATSSFLVSIEVP